MPTNTAFGPQGYNAVTTQPPGTGNNRHGSGVDTWVADCAPGDKNGTILDAAFFNMLLGNMRRLVQQAVADGAAITVSDGDMTLLTQAVKFYGGEGALNVGPGLSLTGGRLTIDISTLKTMTA